MSKKPKVPKPEKIISGVLNFWKNKMTSVQSASLNKFTPSQLKVITSSLYEPVYNRFVATGEICLSQKQINVAAKEAKKSNDSRVKQLRFTYPSSELICIDYLQLYLLRKNDDFIMRNHLQVKAFLIFKLEDRFCESGYTRLQIIDAEFEEAILRAEASEARQKRLADVILRDAERCKTIKTDGAGITIPVDRGKKYRGTTSFVK